MNTQQAPGAEYNNYLLGLDTRNPWHVATYKWSEYETNFRLMWSYDRGQLYNRLGGRLALLNRTEARLVHWPEDGEGNHRCLVSW